MWLNDLQPSKDDLDKLASVLDLDQDNLQAGLGGSYVVHRGESWTWPPKVRLCFQSAEVTGAHSVFEQDPVLYRLYEVLVVYGVSDDLLLKLTEADMSAVPPVLV